MDTPRKNYRPWDAQHGRTQYTAPQQALPEDDLVFFLLDTIPTLNLNAFHDHYASDLRGQPPYDVTLMVTLLVYAYAVGIRSSRKIAAACERNLAFLAIVGDQRPDFRTISDLRKLHPRKSNACRPRSRSCWRKPSRWLPSRMPCSAADGGTSCRRN